MTNTTNKVTWERLSDLEVALDELASASLHAQAAASKFRGLGQTTLADALDEQVVELDGLIDNAKITRRAWLAKGVR